MSASSRHSFWMKSKPQGEAYFLTTLSDTCSLLLPSITASNDLGHAWHRSSRRWVVCDRWFVWPSRPLCCYLWKRLGRLQAIGALVLLVLMSEVYLGYGSRRYLPVALSFLVCLCFININLKVIVGGLGCSVILLLFTLGSTNFVELNTQRILSSDSQMVSRGLGYRDS